MLKKEDDILGKLRSFKVFQIAIFDVVATIFGAFLLWKGLTHFTELNLSFLFVVCGMFLLGIVSHRIFGIRTTVDKFLFP
jgi:hypothetical protein